MANHWKMESFKADRGLMDAVQARIDEINADQAVFDGLESIKSRRKPSPLTITKSEAIRLGLTLFLARTDYYKGKAA